MEYDTIELTGMEFYGYHGCLTEEREKGQLFLVDVMLYLALREAGQKDDLHLTVNYAQVQEDVRHIVCGEAVNLIETVAERIVTMLLARYELLKKVSVCVHKPQAPVAGNFRDINVKITRLKNEIS